MATQVKIFDEEHEKDLEENVNQFLGSLSDEELVDIQYRISHFGDHSGQIYSYSAMVVYKD